MARRRRRPLVPGSQPALDQLKATVMKKQGYDADIENPNDVKFEVAEEVNVPLKKGYNGHLTSHQAGKVGGQIGGSMVKELVRMAQERLKNNNQ
ncbi:alpha/beta-type small acid-soluble spore protein [Bacillus sp. 31A1R]|uniref:Alpha/beta-type small acid-soluble spore protein n=1 Tax=Robertmurraya mangrovi TaxID=3098077 RepID=A0ABU5J412_9BACI|nr:alpha/beta-type small acid-soluble spore protein [Bacillus sp. 31A1R]MDZ5474116.1 alpha/beta-type small acid-soluble spore protein [Bacillus sp. 31A1R]